MFYQSLDVFLKNRFLIDIPLHFSWTMDYYILLAPGDSKFKNFLKIQIFVSTSTCLKPNRKFNETLQFTNLGTW